jgi:hypothetical protein
MTGSRWSYRRHPNPIRLARRPCQRTRTRGLDAPNSADRRFRLRAERRRATPSRYTAAPGTHYLQPDSGKAVGRSRRLGSCPPTTSRSRSARERLIPTGRLGDSLQPGRSARLVGKGGRSCTRANACGSSSEQVAEHGERELPFVIAQGSLLLSLESQARHAPGPTEPKTPARLGLVQRPGATPRMAVLRYCGMVIFESSSG